MRYYVSAAAPQSGDGSKDHPFSAIGQAAAVARAGDEILVAPGVYRESVDPLRGGTAEDRRIVYRSEVKGGAVITGAEPVKGWTHFQNQVWTVRIPNELFGDYNPYTVCVQGDWYNPAWPCHAGEVYLNGKSMYEAPDLDSVLSPQVSRGSWDRDFSKYQWYTCQDGGDTVLYANFQGADPNRETVEINVRRNCFFPSKTGVNYITLSGFRVRQAATQWAPPTAFQDGMIGPHWSKGWIIEDCEVSDSKCSGISLGKYRQPCNDNKWTTRYRKDGTQNERDAVCQAVLEGWNKETVGSHTVRRCHIHDCGQAGIVGHMGGAFSRIEYNHIHHINHKRELSGAEIGGIKLHAAVDTVLWHNHIHHCTRGLWLDWQAQGTRVTGNLFHDNVPPVGTEIGDGMGEDLFVEVSHGPTLIDNNLLLSDCACRLSTQGLAFVHNLIAGSFTFVGIGTDNGTKRFPSPRYTPYHVPHSTALAGFMTILHGDARFYNNLFVQKPVRADLADYARESGWDGLDQIHFVCGTKPYDGYPTAAEYFGRFTAESAVDWENRDLYYDHLPVCSGGNVYFNGAQPWNGEQDACVDIDHPVALKLEETEGRWILCTDLYDFLPERETRIIDTALLGEAFEPEQWFEQPDGSPIVFDRGYHGTCRGASPLCGPFAAGAARIPL